MADIIGYKVLVTKTGTEKEFVSELINTITGLSSKITCSGSVDQYDSGDTSTIPEFIFSINGKAQFKLKRHADISTASNQMDISIFTGTRTLFTNEECSWSTVAQTPSTSGTRAFYISWIVSGDFILLAIHAGVEHYGYKNHVIVNIKSGDKCYGDGYYVSYNQYLPRNILFNIKNKPLSQNPPFVFYEFDTGVTGSFVSRFDFISRPGTIDYVKSAAYINNGYKAFDVTAVYDCATVNIGDTVSLNDGAYLAVGTNQLVKVS